ncbi:MAG TPA: arginine--tRNA ligase, partial [candidate division Zixibacteria bacterium]|nr:arginine--tRNA ligase [candidate division Zixibacteria bacterium]
VEYSSVNIAKPFGIGHLRTTILGNSLRRIFAKLGYRTVGMNYLGDWGTQFGKMIVAYRQWGGGLDLSDNAVEKLVKLYVRFHQEAEGDEALNEQARKAFKDLEDGEPSAVALWQQFRDLSIAEFMRVYRRLGIEFDVITGEAYLNKRMGPMIERLVRTGLASESQGALIVDLGDPQLPPLLLRKADGATLYSTRDLAGAFWRWESYRFHECLYVVATQQADHFRQVFRTVALVEEAENVPPEDRFAGRLKHIDFGWVRFGDANLSTRAGNIIFLEDVIDKAVALAREKIAEKNPGLVAIEDTAEMIGIGAVMFSQMSVRRQKDVNFDWDEVLSFEGETGPYLQYTHARLCSLLRNYGREVSPSFDPVLLERNEEQRVIEALADFPEAVADAARAYDPFYVAAHLIRLAGAFNKLYQRKNEDGRIDKIISDDPALTEARIALVKAVQIVINEGLRLLGIRAPEEM